jgi:signal transduction histidine kinase
MFDVLRRHAWWIAAWAVVTAAGSWGLAQWQLNRLRDAFETDARIAHRLLSQRAVQHDAILATLALLQPAAETSPPEQRLPSVYPQIIGVQRRDHDAQWPAANLRAAETLSRALRRPALAEVDFAQGRYQMVLAATPSSFALEIDLRAAIPWGEWPMAPDVSPVRVTLEHATQTFALQPGKVQSGGWRYEFHKLLAADSQPFDVSAVRQVGWGELPWPWMAGWAAAAAAACLVLRSWQRQRAERQRAEELLRLGQVARLNTMGELAAGMAHELNQPLTAVLANTQAASRLLNDDPPELETARKAMGQAVEQARRASAVVGQLRRTVERPDTAAQVQSVPLQEAVRNALYLLEPELVRRHVALDSAPATAPVAVLAEPVALEQIIHNLLMNAIQALEQVPAPERKLHVALHAENGQGVLTVADNGPGMAPEVLPRVFEPFFSTRKGGLGLGLSLCEALASGMGGSLRAAHHAPRGAAFHLSLPLAAA